MSRRQNHSNETGTRIMVDAGPWPERIGCRGTIVTGSMNPSCYPRHGLGKTEVIILLDNDPLGATRRTTPGEPEWTCVLDRGDVWEIA